MPRYPSLLLLAVCAGCPPPGDTADDTSGTHGGSSDVSCVTLQTDLQRDDGIERFWLAASSGVPVDARRWLENKDMEPGQ